MQDFPSDAFKTSILHAQVEAAFQGHDLAAFEPVDERGYEARCRRCKGSVWVGVTGLLYSVLSDRCSGVLEQTNKGV